MATKLAWQSLSPDNTNLPDDLREAIESLAQARAEVEDMVRKTKPAPKGRRWVFTYRYGVAIALADAGSSTTSYFD